MLECVDVIGRSIRLDDRLWEAHVLTQRPWMRGWESDVQRALERPERIQSDRNRLDRECYYGVGTPLDPEQYLKVVVEFDADGRGLVITAHPTRRLTPEELQLWPEIAST